MSETFLRPIDIGNRGFVLNAPCAHDLGLILFEDHMNELHSAAPHSLPGFITAPSILMST